jgi:hypothetical protein
MRRAMWGLPQAGILANKCLRRKLAPFGYYKCVNTPDHTEVQLEKTMIHLG